MVFKDPCAHWKVQQWGKNEWDFRQSWDKFKAFLCLQRKPGPLQALQMAVGNLPRCCSASLAIRWQHLDVQNELLEPLQSPFTPGSQRHLQRFASSDSHHLFTPRSTVPRFPMGSEVQSATWLWHSAASEVWQKWNLNSVSVGPKLCLYFLPVLQLETLITFFGGVAHSLLGE